MRTTAWEQQSEAQLSAMTAAERLTWAVGEFGEQVLATSSFGADSAVLLHLLAQQAPNLPVYFINTGFLFAETLDYQARLTQRLGTPLRELRPEPFGPDFVAQYGELYRTDANACCQSNKVAVLARALEGAACWISGLRRDQSDSRKSTPFLQRRADGLYKLHPLADWTQPQVTTYMRQHKLPLHPLAVQGYTSIGCQPCTAKPLPGADERSGRWAGQDKTECGLHV